MDTILQRAGEILLRAPVQNAYPLCVIAQGNVDECAVSGNGVRLRDRETGKYCYAFDDFADFLALYEPVKQRGGLMLSLVTNSRFADNIAACGQTMRLGRFCQLVPLPRSAPAPEVLNISYGPITPHIADWILSVYEHPELTREFIEKRARTAPNVAAFRDGAPVGFFMTHSGAELGPVYVAPELRGTGLAEALYGKIMCQVGEQKHPPVLFVRPENTVSMGFLQRMGCRLAEDRLLWFWHE